MNTTLTLPVMGMALLLSVLAPLQGHASFTRLEHMPIDIVEVIVTAHQFSDEFRYSSDPDPQLGALVRLVVRHRDKDGAPIQLRLRFNGKTAPQWLASGDWKWYEMPDNLGAGDVPWQLEPDALAVFTFNAASAAWGVGNDVVLDMEDGLAGTHETVTMAIREGTPRLHGITGLAAEKHGIIPERLIIHLSNSSASPMTLIEAAVYHELQVGRRAVVPFTALPEDNSVPPGERMVVRVETGRLPLRHGLVELVFQDVQGATVSRWARLRFKADRFDIGSGWLMIPSRDGIVPLLQESFLKTLKRMHVNLFWGESVPGYTDDDGPAGLYTRYPMRQMAYFEEIERYNTDAWTARIHGVDRLGEPQHIAMQPMEVYETLKHYDAARYPTTLTLSDEKDWRYWAGICDFPHYDSYRVSAPAMDTWRLYDCWDRRLFWGAPLEGIGVMTRSLRELSEPVPIALWSQNMHEGWQDQFTRKRRSPTPDEILIQAYQGLANGITSLYWYSLQSWSLLKYRDAIDVTTRIGREIRLLEDLYLSGAATHHARVGDGPRPELEFNVISAPEAAVLFAMDLGYVPDHEERVFTFRGSREIQAEFPLPSWLRTPVDVFRVDADGVHDVDWQGMRSGVRINDTLDRVGVYIATRDSGERARRQARIQDLKAYEQSIAFDPGANDADFQILMNDLGFKDLSELE